ncbi:hypothetical protein N5B96_03960 [Acinetobacter johnsonii]|uniref:Uncharacterized protein n=2 Tax=Acinetobacter johnsonii TaxID=40214 RepID=A0A427V0C8_ACIJO|nr:hypothetical protein [Acinetobacter johnsonii]MDH0711869.1 hypothetical protein [Acinetobacter johnsonii]MDH1068653.1 hypothetical protein [Acinetobacter johnsonii]PZO93061.1 MAG: hypothetical protein DI631_07570 [Acinetobacter johnsonii]RSE26251.1 hypothetical protein EGT73_02960 [Acinetobacter johnsonii]
MRRIVLILVLATSAVFGWMFYQYSQQQKEQQQLQRYETVLYEKTEQIYKQAQDWTTPIQVDVKDPRLTGDYQIMAEFVLSHMLQNAEARNQYLRDLKALNWDQFLNIDRLSKDKKNNYAETEQMLKDVHAVVESYAQQVEQRQKEAIAQAKDLAISSRFRYQLTDSMKASEKSHEATRLFSLEQQNLAKADQIFLVLKNNQWEKKNNTFMFYEDAPLQQFNALYKEILALNSQMKQVEKQTQKEVEQKL